MSGRLRAVEQPTALTKLPSEQTDEVIAATVARLNELGRGAALQLALAIGRVVVEELYGGDLDAWRRVGPKATSFQKLAAHPDLQISTGGLSRACGLYELVGREGIGALDRLTATHGYVVLGLPRERQLELLDRARDEGWSSRELFEAARTLRRAAGDRRGRPALPAFVKSVHRMAKLLEHPAKSLADLEAVDEMDPGEVRELHRKLSEVRDRLRELEERLRRRVEGPAGD